MTLREGTSRDLLVESDRGAVRGIRRRGVRSWRGIPYGADTGGVHRFRAPSPAPGWDGVRDATEFGPVTNGCVPGVRDFSASILISASS